MIERYYHAVLLAVILLLAAGCQIGPAPLSQQQLQEFIRQQHIQPLAVEEVGGMVTVILYKDARKMGCYIAFARNGIESIHLINNPVDLKGKTFSPVSFTHTAVLGQYILCMTINDGDIQAKADTVRIVFPNKKEVLAPVNNGGNMIISQTTEVNESGISITIYDSNQIEIIRSPFW